MSVASAIVPTHKPMLEPLPERPSPRRRYLTETTLLIGRSLRTIRRVPERLADVTLQPIIFVLLFLYVFGSAIDIPGVRYQDYLLPGMLGQTLAFSVIGIGVATCTDFTNGVIDRFRSLPITRLSVLTAQVLGQMLEQILGMVIVMVIGLILGWRPDLTLASGLEFAGLLLIGIFAFSWLGVTIGMHMRSADAMQGIGFAIVFPLTFLAGAFVPIEGMALIPRVVGEWDPIAAFIAALREVSQGVQVHGSWQLENPVISMIIWCVLIIAVCVPLALRRLKTLTAN